MDHKKMNTNQKLQRGSPRPFDNFHQGSLAWHDVEDKLENS